MPPSWRIWRWIHWLRWSVAEDGRAALETALALRESHRRGGIKVRLPLEDRSLGILSSEIGQDGVPARVRRVQAAAAPR